tara:strand:+ start:117 stop:713 length:597 start_codon:yes stop_codon:yes gene_type:complete
MDRSKFIENIKAMFSDEEKEIVLKDKPAEVEFADVTTEDGIILRTAEAGMIEGEKVEIVSVDEEGVETVAPAVEGEYSVEGKVVTLDAEGVIVSIVEAEEEAPKEEEVVEAELSEVKEEKEEVMPKWAEGLVSRLEAIELANSNLAESMSAIDDLSAVVSKIANLPADEEIKLSKTVSAKQKKANSRDEKLKFLSKRK